MMSERERQVHWRFGRHSNIPDCCIRFFIEKWDCQRSGPRSYAAKIDKCHWGYVPCPMCLKMGNRVHIRDCQWECGTDCGKRYWAAAHDEPTGAYHDGRIDTVGTFASDSLSADSGANR